MIRSDTELDDQQPLKKHKHSIGEDDDDDLSQSLDRILARFLSLSFVCMGSIGLCMYSPIINVFSGYLALSVGVAGSDRQARVGAVWVGWWESSKPRLPDRRAFVTRVGRAGERKIFVRRWRTA
jgi:hypothetical protein